MREAAAKGIKQSAEIYRQPAPSTIELVDVIRGERDLRRRVH